MSNSSRKTQALKKSYYLVLIIAFLIVVAFFPLGLQSERGVSKIEQSVQLTSTDESIKEISKLAFNVEDIVVVIKTKNNNTIITNQTSLLISNITYFLRQNKTIYERLRSNKLIRTLFTEGRNLVKNYYSAIQKIALVGNITTFSLYNGTYFFINSTINLYSQTSNTTYSILEAKNQTSQYLETKLNKLSGGYFFIEDSLKILENITNYYKQLARQESLVLQNKSFALEKMDEFINKNMAENLSRLISEELSLFFKQLVLRESLLGDFWNETLLYQVVAKWCFNNESDTYVKLVEKSFAGGNMVKPIDLADNEYLAVLRLEQKVPGLKKEIIFQLLQTFTNFDPEKEKKPTITVFVIPINATDLTLKQYIGLYNMIYQVTQQQASHTNYEVEIFSSRMLEVEIGEQYSSEFIRIDLWIGVVVLIVLFLLFRKVFTSILGFSLLLISNFTGRGFLLFIQQHMGVIVYKEGYVIGNSLLLGATINYVVFIFSLYYEKYTLPEKLRNKRRNKLGINPRIFNSYITVMITSSVLYVALSPLLLSVSLKSFQTLGLVIITELPVIIFIIFSFFPLIGKIMDKEPVLKLPKSGFSKLKKKKIQFLIPHEKTVTFMLKNAKKMVVITIFLWIFLSTIVYSSGFSQDPLDMMGKEGQNQTVLTNLLTEFPDEFFSKLMIIVQFDEPLPDQLLLNNTVVSELEKIVALLSRYQNKGIFSPVSPYGKLESNPQHEGNLTQLLTDTLIESFMSLDKTKALVIFVTPGNPFSSETGLLVTKIMKSITEDLLPRLSHVQKVIFGGAPYQTSIYTTNILRDFIVIMPLSIILSFSLLAFWTRSFFLPVRFQYTVITGFVISIFFAQFISLIIFKSPLNFLVILTSFGLLNALGLDFDIYFYIHYLKEKGTKTEKIVAALEKSFNSILSAGIIMIFSFAGLMFSPMMILKQLGLCISISILIDIFFVRFFLSPVIIGFVSKETISK